MSIKDNLEKIQNRINEAEIKSGRKTGSVNLMAVSKFHPQSSVLEAIQAGQFLFGENRVQEASQKFPEVFETYPQAKLHMIGQLQSNKVRNAVKVADCIQSVDRIELLEEIEKQCAKIEKKIKILFEVHTGEESKSGFKTTDELKSAIDLFGTGKFTHIIPCGLMTMAPFTEEKALIHKSFSTLRELSEKLKSEYKALNFDVLSMGMSGDFEIAIEEGSTLVRVGTAIFGERDYTK